MGCAVCGDEQERLVMIAMRKKEKENAKIPFDGGLAR
jgi:hypothetical protein